jgi:hypothetical protein
MSYQILKQISRFGQGWSIIKLRLQSYPKMHVWEFLNTGLDTFGDTRLKTNPWRKSRCAAQMVIVRLD